jgi:hypothetical protein
VAMLLGELRSRMKAGKWQPLIEEEKPRDE